MCMTAVDTIAADSPFVRDNISTYLKVYTGGAFWLAQSFVDLLPEIMSKGAGPVIGASLLTGTMASFFSEGAALGPIVLPMATLADIHVRKKISPYNLKV